MKRLTILSILLLLGFAISCDSLKRANLRYGYTPLALEPLMQKHRDLIPVWYSPTGVKPYNLEYSAPKENIVPDLSQENAFQTILDLTPEQDSQFYKLLVQQITSFQKNELYLWFDNLISPPRITQHSKGITVDQCD